MTDPPHQVAADGFPIPRGWSKRRRNAALTTGAGNSTVRREVPASVVTFVACRGCPIRTTRADAADQRLLCRFRPECLGFAAHRKWRGMSCAGCRDYQPQTDAERRAEMAALASFARALDAYAGL